MALGLKEINVYSDSNKMVKVYIIYDVPSSYYVCNKKVKRRDKWVISKNNISLETTINIVFLLRAQ